MTPLLTYLIYKPDDVERDRDTPYIVREGATSHVRLWAWRDKADGLIYTGCDIYNGSGIDTDNLPTKHEIEPRRLVAKIKEKNYGWRHHAEVHDAIREAIAKHEGWK